MTARRRYVASSMFSLLLLATARLAVSSRDIFPICTSMCEGQAANRPDARTVPCSITPTCISGRSVPNARAPGSPVNITVQSEAGEGPDNRVYLSIAPQWYAPEDRISELTGFVVRIICMKSNCMSSNFCFTMTFNRSLTAADEGSKFSMSCLFGNFSMPDTVYTVIAHSLPHDSEDSNRVQSRITLPSCREQERVALCLGSMEYWEPTKRPLVSLRGARTVAVFTWPMEGRDDLAVRYEVFLQESHSYALLGPEYTDSSRREAKFYNVPDGTYSALMKVSECDACTLFRSSNTIQIPASEPTFPVPSTREVLSSHLPATMYTSHTPREDISQKDSPASGSALVLYVVGGCFGGIFLILVVSAIACRSKLHTACCSVVKGKSSGPAIDLSTRSVIQSNNGSNN